MGITKRTDGFKISPKKLKEVKVHWSISKPMSQEALENFNHIIAKAQLRVYSEFLKTK